MPHETALGNSSEENCFLEGRNIKKHTSELGGQPSAFKCSSSILSTKLFHFKSSALKHRV